MRVAVFGLGEAGALIAGDLARAGVPVAAFDPAQVATPEGVARATAPTAAVAAADAVLAITGAAEAADALHQALDHIPSGALYADFSSSTAMLQRELAATADRYNLVFADVAVMSTVPGKGLRVPVLTAGPGAQRFADTFAPLGMPVTVISDAAGDAATRKLLRSVVMKGLAATVIEALRAGHAAGCGDWLWRNIVEEITAADGALLTRLVQGTGKHATRRLHEMEAAQAALQELQIAPLLTAATVENLRRIPEDGMPAIPDEP